MRATSLAALLACSSAAASPSLLLWSPPGAADPVVAEGLVNAAVAGTRLPPSSLLQVEDEASLCGNLTAAAAGSWLIVPSYVSLPLGTYEDATRRTTTSASAPAPCCIGALSAFLSAGGKWLVAPGQRPTGWFTDIPVGQLAMSLFSPYEVFQAGGEDLRLVAYNGSGGRGGGEGGAPTLANATNLTSAVAFPNPALASFSPLVEAFDSSNRTAGWAASVVTYPPSADSSFPNSCWVLTGVLEPPAAYSEEAFVGAIAAGISGCAATAETAASSTSHPPSSSTFPPSPPFPPARIIEAEADPCPCPARGSPSSPLLPRLSVDSGDPTRRHLVYPNGSAFVVLGMDTFRDAALGMSNATTARLFEEASIAGANAVRLYGWDPATSPSFSCALDCATMREIYLLVTVDGHTDFSDRDDLVAHAQEVARAVASETVVFGLDYQNEPYTYQIAAMKVNASTNVTLAEKYGLEFDGPYGYSAYSALLDPGSFSTFNRLTNGLLPQIPGFEAFLAAMDSVWGEWAGWYLGATKPVAPLTLACVGMNTWEELVPGLYAPQQPQQPQQQAWEASGRRSSSGGTSAPSQSSYALDFSCHHAYADSGFGYENASVVSWVPTVEDRIANNAAGTGHFRPVLLGETGASNGETINGMPFSPSSAPYLDRYAAAAFDILPHLLSLSHGHSGAIRWEIEDHPFVWAVQGEPWNGNATADAAKFVQQGRFGAFWSDGRLGGGGSDLTSPLRPKPTVFALRAVRGLLDDLQGQGMLAPGGAAWAGYGNLTVGASLNASNPIRSRVVYGAAGALVVADVAFLDDPGCGLSFWGREGVVATVVVRWSVAAAGRGRTQQQRQEQQQEQQAEEAEVCVVSSADVTAEVDVSAFVPGEPPPGLGGAGTRRRAGAPVVLSLLEGEEICLGG